MKKLVISLALLSLTACSSVMYTKTGFNEYQPNSQGCEFTVHTTNPNKEFEELGLVEFNTGYWDLSTGGPSSLRELKELSSSDVCSSGGNGLLAWEASSTGVYKKATIIKFK